MAKPVAPQVQPKAVAPRSGGSRRSAREEEVGSRSGRTSRAPARGGGGMGLGTKVGLIVGLLTLLVAAVAVLASGSGGTDAEDALNEIGFRTVGELAGVDPSNWLGDSRPAGVDGFAAFRKNFQRVFGESRASYFDQWVEQDTDTEQWADLDPVEKEEAQARLNAFNEAKQELQGGGAKDDESGPPPGAGMMLADMVQRARVSEDFKPSGTTLLGAWIREGKMKHEGEFLLGYGASKSTDVVPGGWLEQGPVHYSDGKIKTSGGEFDVRIFATSHKMGKTTAYVAVWQDPALVSGGGGKTPLGLGIAALGAILAGFLASMIANNHTQGVRTLAREIDRLGTSGDPTRTLHAHGPEAGALARSVERMVGNLEFRSKHDDQDLDEVISKEQKVAAEIHGALIDKNPPELTGYEVETFFKPGVEIGGDHFDYFQIDDNHLGVVLLDTNVRGLSAALVMAQAKAYLRAVAPNNLSPSDVLRQVNRHLAGELPGGRHVTALYCVIDTAEGKVSIASAGHLPLIVYRHSEGKVFKVNPEGIALGLDKGTVFDRSIEEGDIPLQVGDRIVLYTDGALLVQNDESEEFGEQRFYQAVAKEAPKNSQAFVNFVGSAIDQFHLSAMQNDDITISTVKRLK